MGAGGWWGPGDGGGPRGAAVVVERLWVMGVVGDPGPMGVVEVVGM